MSAPVTATGERAARESPRAAHLPGMDLDAPVAAAPAKRPKKKAMATCQTCSGGKAPKGGGQVVCLYCSTAPTEESAA